MKIPIAILVLLLITYVKNQTCSNVNDPTSAADCKDEYLTDTEKKNDYVHCCYVTQVKCEDCQKKCRPFTSKQMENLNTIIKNRVEGNEFDYDISIDCKSSYLKAGLILLISFILF